MWGGPGAGGWAILDPTARENKEKGRGFALSTAHGDNWIMNEIVNSLYKDSILIAHFDCQLLQIYLGKLKLLS